MTTTDPDTGDGTTRAFRLLGMNAPFRALFVARTTGFAGESIALVALMLFVADSTGQAIAVSLLLLAGDFLPALLGPLTGVISDRFDRKRVMVVCEALQAALFLLIALWLPPLPWLLVLVGCC